MELVWGTTLSLAVFPNLLEMYNTTLSWSRVKNGITPHQVNLRQTARLVVVPLTSATCELIS